MNGMYPPGYSYVYGPPGSGNSKLNEAAEKLNRSADLLSTFTRRLTSGIQDVGTAFSRAKPPVIKQAGIDVYSPNHGFVNTRVSSSLLGTSYSSPAGTRNVYSNFYTDVKRDQFNTSVLGRGASTATSIGAFFAGSAATPLFLISTLIDEAVNMRMSKLNMKSDMAALSPKLFSRSLTGRTYAGMNREEVDDVINSSKSIFDNGKYSFSDIRGMNKSALKGGWFASTQNISEYTTRFKEYVSLVGEIQEALNKTSFEAGKIIEQFNRVGIDNSRKIRRFVALAKETSSRYSVDMNSLTQFGISTGGAIENQYGLGIGPASGMAMKFYGAAGTAFRSGNISGSEYRRMGGDQGVAGISSQTTANLMANNPMFQMYLYKRFNVSDSGVVTQNPGYTSGMSYKDVVNKLDITSSPMALRSYGSRILSKVKDSPEIVAGLIEDISATMPNPTRANVVAMTQQITGLSAEQANAYLSTLAESRSIVPDLTGTASYRKAIAKSNTPWSMVWNGIVRPATRTVVGGLENGLGAISNALGGARVGGTYMGINNVLTSGYSPSARSDFSNVVPVSANAISPIRIMSATDTDILNAEKFVRNFNASAYSNTIEGKSPITGFAEVAWEDFARLFRAPTSNPATVKRLMDTYSESLRSNDIKALSIRSGLGNIANREFSARPAAETLLSQTSKSPGVILKDVRRIYKSGEYDENKINEIMDSINKGVPIDKKELLGLSSNTQEVLYSKLSQTLTQSALAKNIISGSASGKAMLGYKETSKGMQQSNISWGYGLVFNQWDTPGLSYESAKNLINQGVTPAVKIGNEFIEYGSSEWKDEYARTHGNRGIYQDVYYAGDAKALKAYKEKFPEANVTRIDSGHFKVSNQSGIAGERYTLVAAAARGMGGINTIAFNRALVGSDLDVDHSMHSLSELKRVYTDDKFAEKYFKKLEKADKGTLAEKLRTMISSSGDFKEFQESIIDMEMSKNVLSMFRKKQDVSTMTVDTINVTNFNPPK